MLGKRRKNSGSVLVYSMASLVVLTGFASLAIDWGRVEVARSELQQAADGAAFYGAAGLPLGITEVNTRAAAAVADNKSDGTTIDFRAANDVEFGVWDQATRTFVTLSGTARSSATAIRVTTTRLAARSAAMPLTFGNLIGKPAIDLSAKAIVARGRPASVNVDADSCPWLAGMPSGSSVAGTGGNTIASIAPAQSPPCVSNISIVGGAKLVFRQASGQTSYTGSGNYGPDGNTDWIVAQDAVNGINTTKAPLNAMVAIFLDDRVPSTYAMSVEGDFSSPASRDFSTLSPPLKQVFFVGDGLNSAGQLQTFVVLHGATRMFIGIMDEKGWWWDNVGVLSTTFMDDHVTLVR